MLVEDTRATFRIGLLVQPGKLEIGVWADMPDFTILRVEIIFVFPTDFHQIGVVLGLCSKPQCPNATAQLISNTAVVSIDVGIGSILVIARVYTEASIIDVTDSGLSAKPHCLVAQENTAPPVFVQHAVIASGYRATMIVRATPEVAPVLGELHPGIVILRDGKLRSHIYANKKFRRML